GRGIGGDAHLVAYPRQCLAQDGANRRVVVRDKDISADGHAGFPSNAGVSFIPRGSRHVGMRMRNVVPRGDESHSITPPCSPTILATSASPRPEPFCLVVMKGSNRIGSRSSGT